MTRKRWLLAGLGLLVTLAGGLEAQRRFYMQDEPNVPYDGRFTFIRLRYEGSGGNPRDPGWRHDYPRGERHFTKILSELSTVKVRTEESNILDLSDNEIFKYPVLYMSEPGFWQPSELDVTNLRKYLQKGGFLIFDDFRIEHAEYNLYGQIKRVIPGATIIDLDTSHPIFDSFYRIASLDYQHPVFGGASKFQAVFEDNDPTKRMLMLLNTHNDLSEYWEYSDEGYFPIEASNEAYKLGINYIVYALTR